MVEMVAEMVVMVEMVAVEVMVTVVGTAVMVVEEGLDQFERNLLGDHDSRPRTNTSS